MNVNRREFLHRSMAIAALAGQVIRPSTAMGAISSESVPAAVDGRRDFDFFLGHWGVAAKRLRHRLTGEPSWQMVTGKTRVFQILQGAGNMDEDEFQLPGQVYVGGMLRLFDAKHNNWTTYGLDRDSGALQSPLSGRFDAGRGEFHGEDEEAGRPIKVRHLYVNLTPATCRWEQAFSADVGKTWETNWIIEFTRLAPPPNPS